ncbi:hypothetical protein [Microbacterium sp. CCH5-D1]|uniref:hypothetical protein n=1 Tax=Microbacterium sp. CCH5-D1 TaxID=1768780 RepID=UPI000769DA41|nr:hypothetical protein [Microbacterium sp. CCH5-D1]
MTARAAAVEESSGSSTGRRRALGVTLVVAALALAIDQGAKALAVAQLPPGERGEATARA